MSNLPEGNSENAGSIGVVSAEHSIAHDRLGGQVDDSRWSDDHLNLSKHFETSVYLV